MSAVEVLKETAQRMREANNAMSQATERLQVLTKALDQINDEARYAMYDSKDWFEGLTRIRSIARTALSQP